MKNEQTFEGVGGLNIFMRSWRPEGTPRGVTVLIHGFNAHSGYMTWPAERFAVEAHVHEPPAIGRGRPSGSPRTVLPLTLSTYAVEASQKANDFTLSGFRTGWGM